MYLQILRHAAQDAESETSEAVRDVGIVITIMREMGIEVGSIGNCSSCDETLDESTHVEE